MIDWCETCKNNYPRSLWCIDCYKSQLTNGEKIIETAPTRYDGKNQKKKFLVKTEEIPT